MSELDFQIKQQDSDTWEQDIKETSESQSISPYNQGKYERYYNDEMAL